MNWENRTRTCLKDVTPYLPGKPIGEVRRELGLKRVIKLASNENPLGASPRALSAARKALTQCSLYPEGSSPLLRGDLAARLGVDVSQVIVGNGSDEIIRLVAEAFLEPGDEVVVSRYSFIRFEQSSRLMGAGVVSVPMREWRHDLGAMAGAVTPKTKVVFIASPNNPTGTYNTHSEVEEFLKRVRSDVVVVLDEAYFHFAALRRGYQRSIPRLLVHPNLLVLRTFSKAYGLAGFRVGYGVGSPELVRLLNRVRMPFNVNLPGQAAAQAALSDEHFVKRTVQLTEEGKEFLLCGLKKLGTSPLESAANFVFVELPSAFSGRQVFQALLRSGIIVRPMDEYGLLRHIRISVGLPRENRQMLRALSRILNEKKTDHRC